MLDFFFIADIRYFSIDDCKILLRLKSRRHVYIVVLVIRNKVPSLFINTQKVRLCLFKKEKFSHIFTLVFSFLNWNLAYLYFTTFIDPSISWSNPYKVSFKIDFFFIILSLERNCFRIKDTILRQHWRNNKVLIYQHFLFIFWKDRELIFQFMFVTYSQYMLVIMSKEKTMPVISTLYKDQSHKIFNSYPFSPRYYKFRIITKVHSQVLQHYIFEGPEFNYFLVFFFEVE